MKETLDDLVTLLTKARVVNRLLDFMPPSKRSAEDFKAHFRWSGQGVGGGSGCGMPVRQAAWYLGAGLGLQDTLQVWCVVCAMQHM